MKRTQILTAAAIVAVGISGAIAVAANVGIMNAADNSTVGGVASAADLMPTDTQVVDVYLGPDNTTATGGQEFSVDVAGTVTVSSSSVGVIRLDGVAAASGWSWTLTQTDSSALLVTFTDGARTLEFTATAAADGTITAKVNEPVVVAAAPSQNGGGEHEDDDDEYEGGEDDD
ncbi:MAG: hypothetical protein Q7V57_06120 [Actinomycetota bacterium]|nr:hypothetical protein [Actinomycetota bacterium]